MARRRTFVLMALAGLVLFALSACTTPTGTISLAVTGLPPGVSAVVTVSGTGGYTQAVTATTTLSVATGTYTITVAPAADGDAIVPVMYDGSASSSSVAVTANTTVSATVSYAQRGGSGHLWLPLATNVGAYQHDTLAASGSTGPDVVLTGATTGGSSEALAFDAAGNLWALSASGHLDRFATGSLGSSGTPSPALTIDFSASTSFAYDLAFDASGNVWVCDWSNNEVRMFTAAQLSTSGTVSPTVTIAANAGSLSSPIGLAFDPSGNLWVSNASSTTLVMFTPAQLATTGNPTPTVTIGADATPSLSAPYAIAFDSSGNLWVANAYTAVSVVRYDASQLAQSGNPTPAATIGGASLGSHPEGLAFDASGALWVADYGSEDLRRFTNPGALTATVTPTPDVVLSSIGSTDVVHIAFSPPAANLPINTP